MRGREPITRALLRMPVPRSLLRAARAGLLLVPLLAAQNLRASDWPMFLGNQQLSGNNDALAPAAFDLAWRWDGGAAVFKIVPAGDGVLATLSDRRVAFISLSGKSVWERTVSAPVIRSPVIWRTLAFLVAGRELLCLNLADGKTLWSIANTEFVLLAAPLVADGVLYVGSRGAFQARRAANGQVLWENREIMTWGAAIVKVEDSLLIQHRDYKTMRSSLACLDANTGKTRWLSEIAHDANIFPPLVLEDIILQASADTLAAFSLKDGKPLGKRVFDASFASHPVSMSGQVYLSLADGSIHSIRSTNLQHTVAAFTNYRRQGNTFAASGGHLYLTGDDGALYELAASGEDAGAVTRRLALGLSASHVQPLLSRGLVFLAAGDALFCVGAPPEEAGEPPELPPIKRDRKLWLVDARDGRALDGELRIAWLNPQGRWEFQDAAIQNGYAVLGENVPAGVPLSVEKQGYGFARVTWPSDTLKEEGHRWPSEAAEQRLALTPLVQEQNWVLHNVFFLEDSALLQAASLPELHELARLLKANPRARIIIEGHTDSSGARGYNLGLSHRRAGAVAEFLTLQGIGGWRMESVGYGDTRPIAGNESAEGRMKNRRTEIRILLDGTSRGASWQKK